MDDSEAASRHRQVGMASVGPRVVYDKCTSSLHHSSGPFTTLLLASGLESETMGQAYRIRSVPFFGSFFIISLFFLSFFLSLFLSFSISVSVSLSPHLWCNYIFSLGLGIWLGARSCFSAMQVTSERCQAPPT